MNNLLSLLLLSKSYMAENKKNFDSELQTYFGAIKQAIKQEHVNYLKTHPELRQILNDFLSSCLLEQPENVYDYARNYFSFFNYQKDVKKFNPLVISGCSGVGKGTLINWLLQKFGNLFELSISYTTRRPRQGQVHGREYYFVEKEEFLKEIEKDVFVEYCEVHGNYYGTHQGKLNEIINRGKICLLDIDLQGGQKIKAKIPECCYVFIDAPNFEILEERLKKRGTETSEVVERRMKNAREEVEGVKKLEYYHHIVNEELEKTKKDLLVFINKEFGLNLTLN